MVRDVIGDRAMASETGARLQLKLPSATLRAVLFARLRLRECGCRSPTNARGALCTATLPRLRRYSLFVEGFGLSELRAVAQSREWWRKGTAAAIGRRT
jgi:hypothetical protein